MLDDVSLQRCIPLRSILLVVVSVGWLSLSPTQLMGQDPILTQYFFNKLYLNPAYAGYEGGLVVNSSLRRQWNRIDGVGGTGYRTQMVGASMALPSLMSGVGLQYVHHVEGPGNLVWHRAGLAYAFRSRNCKSRRVRNELNLGFRMSANWTGLNTQSDFTFGDQYHPVRGLVNETNAPNDLAVFPGQAFMDLDLGAVYLHPLRRRKRKRRLPNAEANYVRLGLVANHLPVRNASVSGFLNALPMRYTLHNEWIFRYGNNQFVPMLKVEAQPASSLLLAGTEDRFWAWHQQIGFATTVYDDTDRGIWFGAWYHGRALPHGGDSSSIFFPQPRQPEGDYSLSQHIHSISVAFGGELPLHETVSGSVIRQNLRFGISYDYQFSGITNDGTGILELSLILNVKNFGKGSAIDCPAICPQF
ncbi:MAG: PorP/SprF family type IX secretion system membrane protein [Bacteroidota bacterium]